MLLYVVVATSKDDNMESKFLLWLLDWIYSVQILMLLFKWESKISKKSGFYVSNVHFYLCVTLFNFMC